VEEVDIVKDDDEDNDEAADGGRDNGVSDSDNITSTEACQPDGIHPRSADEPPAVAPTVPSDTGTSEAKYLQKASFTVTVTVNGLVKLLAFKS